MGRYECTRCHVVCFTTNPPHVCKDVAARHKRREKQRDAVVRILAREQAFLRMDGLDGGFTENAVRVAEDIVARLAQMGVTED